MLSMINFSKYAKTAAAALTALCLTSCAWMEEGEDLTGCPTGEVVVQFVYDYNIQRADMFRDHVGEVSLYVFDEAGKLVTQRTVNDRQAISDRNNRFNIKLRASSTPGSADLVAGRSYRFVAVAGQKAGAIVPTTGALPAVGSASQQALYRQTALTAGASASDLYVGLDRVGSADAMGRYAVSSAAPLDTMWHTLGVLPTGCDKTDAKGWNSDGLVKIRANITDSVNVVRHQPEDTITVSLMRDTKHLHVSLHELDAPGNVNADDYEVYITDANGLVDNKNSVLADQPLIYRPYAQRTEDMTDAGVAGTTAHWDMMFNRIMYHEKADDDARLLIVRKSDGDNVARLSLPRVLAYSRIANDYFHLTQQGYLDREYNYNLSFYLKNGKWEETEIWVAIDVNMLSWSIRRQDVELQ